MIRVVCQGTDKRVLPLRRVLDAWMLVDVYLRFSLKNFNVVLEEL